MASIMLDLVVPGTGTALGVLQAIFQLCGEMKESQEACLRVHHRLADILDELTHMEKAQQLPPSDSLAKYSEMLHSYLQYLQRYRGKPLYSRLLQHQTMMEKIRLLNEEVDTLICVLNVATTGAMMEWKQHWEKDCATQAAMLSAIADSSEAILSEVHGTRAQVEAMMVLKFEMDQRQDQHNQQMLAMMTRLLTGIVRSSSASVPSVPPWFIPADDVVYDTTAFARGSFGRVHHGTWGSGATVIVKTLLVDESGASEKAKEQFLNEINVWYKLSHPNVVEMYGACHVASPPFIVCEDQTNGDAASYLSRSASTNKDMWRLLYEAALGLECLHKNRVVHGDVKLNNILVGADGVARITDFGMSFVREASGATSASAAGPSSSGGLRWRAPECLERRATFASDVYSLGMCIIEAVTGAPPFAFADDDTVYRLVRDGKIPPRPREMSDAGWGLVVAMTCSDPSLRRPLPGVIAALKLIVSNAHPSDAGSLRRLQPPSQCGVDTTNSLRGAELATPSMGPETTTSRMKHRYLRRRPLEDHVLVAPSAHERGTDLSKAASQKADAVQSVTADDADHGRHAMIRDAIDTLAALQGITRPDSRHDFKASVVSMISPSGDKASKRASHDDLALLVALLRTGSASQKAAAASVLADLAHIDENHVGIAKAGAIEPLVTLLRVGKGEQIYVAASTLANLACEEENSIGIARAGAIEPLVNLLRVGDADQKWAAGDALANLAYGNKPNSIIMARAGAIDVLVDLLRAGNDVLKCAAVRALGNLAWNAKDNCSSIANAGAIDHFVSLLKCGTDEQKTDTAVALESFMRHADTRRLIKKAGGIEMLQALAATGSHEQAREAKAALRHSTSLDNIVAGIHGILAKGK